VTILLEIFHTHALYSLFISQYHLYYQVPVIAVVGNDACWTQIAREQVPMFQSSIGCDLAVSFPAHKIKYLIPFTL